MIMGRRAAAMMVVGFLLAGCGGGQKKALSTCQGALFVCHADLDKSNASAARCGAELGGVRRAGDLAQARVDDFTRLWTVLEPTTRDLGTTWMIRDGYLVAGIPGDTLFEHGETALTAIGREGLARIAVALSSVADRAIIVVGHADDASLGKKKKTVKTDNWEISMARALVVVRELEKGGLPLSRLMAAGVGDKDPIAADGSPSELSLNRRVEVIIAPTDDEVSTLHRAL